MTLSKNYIAGFFDGEGHISIPKYKHRGYVNYRMTLRVGITNCYKPVLEELKKQYGGSLIEKSWQKKKGQIPCYEWNCSSNLAKLFLQDVISCLVVKKEQAELAIEFQNLMRKQGQTFKTEKERTASYEEKNWYYKKLAELKLRTKNISQPQRLSERTPEGDAIVQANEIV